MLGPPRIAALAGCAIFAFVAPAAAQTPQLTPYSTTYAEGPGLRVGSSPLVVHPGFAIDVGYDSNVFYRPQAPVGAGLLRLRAHLDLATLPPQYFEDDHSTAPPKVDFRLSAQAEYREYLSDRAEVQEQRNVNVGASIYLGILPRGPFTLRFNNLFGRTVDPRNAETVANFARILNRTSLQGSYRWARLELGAGASVLVNYWESADVRFGNSVAAEGQVNTRIRVLSQTFVNVIARAGYTEYWNNISLRGVPLRVMAGVDTLFTTWLGASANIGYGNSFNLKGPSYNLVVANLDFRFLLPRGIRLGIGYERDFQDSLLANYYVDDRIFIAFDQPITSRVSSRLDGGVRFRHYDGLVDPTVIGATGFSSAQRDDRIFEAHAEISVRATSWLVCSLNYNFFGTQTDFQILVPTPTSVSFMKHSVFGRVDFSY